MKWLLIVLALAIAPACDAPWAGPNLPDGSHPLNLAQLSLHGPFGMGPDIVASTRLAQLRAQVISRAMGGNRPEALVCQPEIANPDPCWNQQPDQGGRLYVAVVTNYECASTTKEASAVSGHTLHFIHWVGNPQGVCSAMMARPNWRLYSASRSDLPGSGTLTVRLEMQGAAQGSVETKVQPI